VYPRSILIYGIIASTDTTVLEMLAAVGYCKLNKSTLYSLWTSLLDLHEDKYVNNFSTIFETIFQNKNRVNKYRK